MAHPPQNQHYMDLNGLKKLKVEIAWRTHNALAPSNGPGGRIGP